MSLNNSSTDHFGIPIRKAITGACFYLTTCKDAYQHDPTYPCESCSNTVLFDSQCDSACRGIASLKQLVASCHGTTMYFVGIWRGTGRDVYGCQLSKESTVDYEDKINQSQKLFLSPTLPKQRSLRQHVATSSRPALTTPANNWGTIWSAIVGAQ